MRINLNELTVRQLEDLHFKVSVALAKAKGLTVIIEDDSPEISEGAVKRLQEVLKEPKEPEVK